MSAKPFENRVNFGKFIQTQYLFHRDLNALFFNEALDQLLPDLKGRQRLGLIEQDLADLRVATPDSTDVPFNRDDTAFNLAEALGWLYVVEGSNLGAAFLLKDAAKLGLDETFGARHLAGAPEGRGSHWKTFVAALDAVELTAEDENRVISGAEAAFHAVLEHARRIMS
jgi:heme oxygenase